MNHVKIKVNFLIIDMLLKIHIVQQGWSLGWQAGRSPRAPIYYGRLQSSNINFLIIVFVI